MSDFSDYLKIKAAETMPEVTPSIFGEVIEVILTLELNHYLITLVH